MAPPICVRFMSGMAIPEFDSGVAATKKESAAKMSVWDRYILSRENFAGRDQKA